MANKSRFLIELSREPIEGKFKWGKDKDGKRIQMPVYHIVQTHFIKPGKKQLERMKGS
jgi:hypothetical protein